MSSSFSLKVFFLTCAAIFWNFAAAAEIRIHVSNSCSDIPSDVLDGAECKATMKDAIKNHDGSDGTKLIVLVHPGTYKNNNWNDDPSPRKFYLANQAVLSIQGKQHISIQPADPSTRPLIEFDGSGGIVLSGSSNITIQGLEIRGPSKRITGEEASQNRVRLTGRSRDGVEQPCSADGCQSCETQEACSGVPKFACSWKNADTKCVPKTRTYFTGNGIACWSECKSLQIINMHVHECPGSGIRVNDGDDVTIADNLVFDNSWWTTDGSSGLVFAESHGSGQNVLSGNTVFGNRNFMPFFSPNLSDLAHSGTGKEHYSKWNQDYIIDGSGVYITRNYDYRVTFYLTGNTAYDNGINGLVVHKSNNAVVRNNVVFGNGRVSKTREGRQDAGGIVINNSVNVTFDNNTASVDLEDDVAFQCFGTCGIDVDTRNVACPFNVKVNSVFENVVKEASCPSPRLSSVVSGAPRDPQYIFFPTNAPTVSPTQAPTSNGTASPTASPTTSAPTSQPTTRPTGKPTDIPTTSSAPTASPIDRRENETVGYFMIGAGVLAWILGALVLFFRDTFIVGAGMKKLRKRLSSSGNTLQVENRKFDPTVEMSPASPSPSSVSSAGVNNMALGSENIGQV